MQSELQNGFRQISNNSQNQKKAESESRERKSSKKDHGYRKQFDYEACTIKKDLTGTGWRIRTVL